MARTRLSRSSTQQYTVSTNGSNTALQVYNTTVHSQHKRLEHGSPGLQHNSTQSAQKARTRLSWSTTKQYTVSTNGSNAALQVYNTTVHSQHKRLEHGSPGLQHNSTQSAQMARTRLSRSTTQQYTVSINDSNTTLQDHNTTVHSQHKWLEHSSLGLQHNSTQSAQMARTRLSRSTTQPYTVSTNGSNTALQVYNTTVHSQHK